MQNAPIFLAYQRVLEARQQASESREARISRHVRGSRTLGDRLRRGH